MFRNRWVAPLLGAIMTTIPLLATASEPPGVTRLQQILTRSNGGRIAKVFHGPDGMTGVALQEGPKQAIGYITPDGKYFMVGIMVNLATGEDLATEQAKKYLKKYNIISGREAQVSAILARRLPAATVGNPDAPNAVSLIFNPDSVHGRAALINLAALAERDLKTPQLSHTLQFRFIPVGSKAAWILSASNLGALHRIKDLLHGKFPGSTTARGNQNSRNVTNALHSFPLKPPFIIIDMPSAHIVVLTSAKDASTILGSAPK